MAITDRPPRTLPRKGQVGVAPAKAAQLPIFGHQAALDGLRVLAALAVVTLHVAGQTGFLYTGSPASWVASRGDVGVPIFFTLSGLLLFRPWASAALSGAPAPAVRSYLIRRVLRIVPAYWIVVVIALVTLNPGHARSAGAWSQYLLFGQVYIAHPWWRGTGAVGLSQMWSLSVEASFYALLPILGMVLAWLTTRGAADLATRARRMLIAIAVLGVSSYLFTILLFYPTFQPWLANTLPRTLTWFCPGMALAVLAAWAQVEPGTSGPARTFCRTVASAGAACWLIAAFAFIIACTPATGPQTVSSLPSLWGVELKDGLYTIIALAIVAPAAFQPGSSTMMNAVLGNRVMRFLGKISYGVFLWQFVVIIALANVLHVKDVYHFGSFTSLGTAVALVCVIVATSLVATASYYVIEQPAQRLYRLVRPRSAGRHVRKAARTSGGSEPSDMRGGYGQPRVGEPDPATLGPPRNAMHPDVNPNGRSQGDVP